MLFGLTVAGYAFQHKMDTIYNNMDFCLGVAYNMSILGEEDDGSDHDNHLTTFITDGYKPEDDKVQTINQRSQPINVREIQ